MGRARGPHEHGHSNCSTCSWQHIHMSMAKRFRVTATLPHGMAVVPISHGYSATWPWQHFRAMVYHLAMATLPNGHGNTSKRPWQPDQTAMATLPNGHGNSTKRPWQHYQTAMATLPNGHGNPANLHQMAMATLPNGHGNSTKLQQMATSPGGGNNAKATTRCPNVQQHTHTRTKRNNAQRGKQHRTVLP